MIILQVYCVVRSTDVTPAPPSPLATAARATRCKCMGFRYVKEAGVAINDKQGIGQIIDKIALVQGARAPPAALISRLG
ncbi:unnamed protein product, partial [Brenthis ino]